MKIHIKTTNLELTPALNQFIEDKIGSLQKFVKSMDKEGVVEVWFEAARTTRHHQKGDVFKAEADLRLPGRILRSESFKNDLRLAINEVRRELKREIEKYKDGLGTR